MARVLARRGRRRCRRPTASSSRPTPARSSARCCFVAQVLRLGHPGLPRRSRWSTSCTRAAASIDLARLSAALGVPVVGVVGHRGLGLGALRRLLAASRALEPPAAAAAAPSRASATPGWRRCSRACSSRAPGPSRTHRGDRPRRAAPVARHAALRGGDGALLPAHLRVGRRPRWTRSTRRRRARRRRCARRSRRASPPTSSPTASIAGVGSVVVFLPQILLLFTLLYLLEDVGYMARAAFVVDRADGAHRARGARVRGAALVLRLRGAGHHGDAHDPLAAQPPRHDPGRAADDLLGAAAGLRAADRRLRAGDDGGGPLGLQGLVLLGLYVLGARAALAAAAVLKRTLGRGDALPVLPGAAALPRAARCACVASQVWGAARAFLRRAGTIILAVSIVLWVLLIVPAHRAAARARRRPRPRAPRSSTARPGASATRSSPLIAPLGFDWKIGVGLVASLAAREVIVATLAQIYAASDDGRGLAARRDPRGPRPAHGAARLHARHGRRRCSSSSSSRSSACRRSRRHAARDQLLALAGLRLRLPAGARVRRELPHPSGRRCAARSVARGSRLLLRRPRPPRAAPRRLRPRSSRRAARLHSGRRPVHGGAARRSCASGRAARPRLRATGHDLRRPPRAHARADRRAHGRRRRRGERARPAIPTELVYPLGRGALAGARARPTRARRSWCRRCAGAAPRPLHADLRHQLRRLRGSDDLLHLQLSRSTGRCRRARRTSCASRWPGAR